MKKIISILLIVLFASCHLEAISITPSQIILQPISEPFFLKFPLNTLVSYRVTQDIKTKVNILFNTHYRSTSALEFDVKLLEGSEYPFIAELTLTKLNITETKKKFGTEELSAFDSEQEENSSLSFLSKLMNKPLIFKISDEFQVEEMSGFLKDIFKELDEDAFLLAIDTSFFEIFFTQLFQMSNQDLQVNNKYPCICYPLVNMNDEPFQIEDATIIDKSNYLVTNSNIYNIFAKFEGKSCITSKEMGAKIKVEGSVNWNAFNALLQQRQVKAFIKQNYYSILPIDAKVHTEQKWISFIKE